ncbi:hypothetical protein F5Y18DRAFT_442156 [Xylariaceae sp. FL1019]|nr:hypothetical protein F5Y18DRAFT_442156 [Xylariaceae sp. FL1019]
MSLHSSSTYQDKLRYAARRCRNNLLRCCQSSPTWATDISPNYDTEPKAEHSDSLAPFPDLSHLDDPTTEIPTCSLRQCRHMRVYSIGRLQAPRMTDEILISMEHPMTNYMFHHQNNIYHLLNGLVDEFAHMKEPTEEENNYINDVVGQLLNYEFGVNIRPRRVETLSDDDHTTGYAVQVELKPFEDTRPSHCQFILRYVFEQVCQYLVGAHLSYGIDIVHKTILDQIYPNRRWASHPTEEKLAKFTDHNKLVPDIQHTPATESPPQIIVQGPDSEISDPTFARSEGRVSWISLHSELDQIVWNT